MLDLRGDAWEGSLVFAEKLIGAKDKVFQPARPGVLEKQERDGRTAGHVLANKVDVVLGNPLVTVRLSEQIPLLREQLGELYARYDAVGVAVYDEDVEYSNDVSSAQAAEFGYQIVPKVVALIADHDVLQWSHMCLSLAPEPIFRVESSWII